MNWLRAKASFDRATEEVTLVRYEMEWTIRFFEHQEAQWIVRKDLGCSAGHVMYACRQASMWAGFAVAARRSFSL